MNKLQEATQGFGVFYRDDSGFVVPCEAYLIDAEGRTISGDCADISEAVRAGHAFLTYEGHETHGAAEASISYQELDTGRYVVRALPAGTHFYGRDDVRRVVVG